MTDQQRFESLVAAAVLRHAGLGDTLRAIAAELPAGESRRWLRMAEAIDRGDAAAAVASARIDPALWLPLVSGSGPTAGQDAQLLPRLLRLAGKTPGNQWPWLPLLYPVVVVAIAMGVLFALSTGIVPVFAEIFRDFGSSLPRLTRLVLGLATFMKSPWAVVLAGLLVFAGWGGVAWARLFRRRQAAVAAFTRSLAWLVGDGFGQDAALACACQAVGPTTETGPAATAQPAWPLTPAAAAALAQPHAAAAILLEAIADCHDDRGRRRSGFLVDAINTCAIVAVAVLVAMTAMALMLPLVKLVVDLS